MNATTLSTIAGTVITLAGAGWWASETLAKQDDVMVVAAKPASHDKAEQLRYLRNEVERLRQIRSNK